MTEHYVPHGAKLYLADRLIKAGFKRLEVGSISMWPMCRSLRT